jgi:cytochrome c oxidase assembly protein subunit 15
MNRTLRRLAVVTTVFTYLLVAVGGLVRGTESGLGCPDWPRCHGRLYPPLEYHAIIEYSHRATASIVIWLTVALAVVGFRNRRQLTRRVFTLAVIPLPIVLSQAILGAVVVHLDLKAESVVAHLLVAMSLVAVLISLVVEVAPAGSSLALPPPGAARTAIDRRFAAIASTVAGSALFLMLLGSYMAGRGGGLAFRTWPLFEGHVIPSSHGVGPDLHFAHRVVAAVVAVAIFALARMVRRRPQAPPVTTMVRVAAALIGVEILLGAANVWTRLSAVTRTAHLATGALIWGALFTAARLAWRLPAGELAEVVDVRSGDSPASPEAHSPESVGMPQ